MIISLKPAVFAVAILALAACTARKDSDDDAKTTAAVKTMIVPAGDVPEILPAYGSTEVSPSGEQALTAPAEAMVAAVRVSPGAAVAAGQVLIELKPSAGAQAELTKAGVDRDVTAQALARAERLRLSGLDSDADVEQARAAVTTATLAQRSLAQRVGALVIRALHAGVVETLTATPGDQVAAGAPLGKVGAIGAVQMRLGLEASDVSRVMVGQSVILQSTDGAELGVGKVASVQPRVDPQTRLADVIVEARGSSVIGQAVKGDIVLRTVHGPTVPKKAIVYDQDQPAVFVVDGSVAHKHRVTLGPAQGDHFVVTDGLDIGNRIVVEGAAALDDGMAVSAARKSRRSSGAKD